MNRKKINEQLKKVILKNLPSPGTFSTKINGFYFHRIDDTTHSESCFYKAKIAIMLQGRKRAKIGTDEFVYGENQSLVTGIDIPGTSYLVEGSREKPALAMSLDIDREVMTQILADMSVEKIKGNGLCKGLAVTDADAEMLGNFLRLAELLTKNEEAAVLAPVLINAIYTRLLIGPLGRHIREFYVRGTQSNQITRAVSWLKTNFSKPLQVESLANLVHMAPTTFHRHFRKVTAVSPLQYQKLLRLHEARRLMLSENETVTGAAYAVGYESATQFSREYKRRFGASPKRDVSA